MCNEPLLTGFVTAAFWISTGFLLFYLASYLLGSYFDHRSNKISFTTMLLVLDMLLFSALTALVVVGWIILSRTTNEPGCRGLYLIEWVYVIFSTTGLVLELIMVCINACRMVSEQNQRAWGKKSKKLWHWRESQKFWVI